LYFPYYSTSLALLQNSVTLSDMNDEFICFLIIFLIMQVGQNHQILGHSIT